VVSRQTSSWRSRARLRQEHRCGVVSAPVRTFCLRLQQQARPDSDLRSRLCATDRQIHSTQGAYLRGSCTLRGLTPAHFRSPSVLRAVTTGARLADSHVQWARRLISLARARREAGPTSKAASNRPSETDHPGSAVGSRRAGYDDQFGRGPTKRRPTQVVQAQLGCSPGRHELYKHARARARARPLSP
jgi:hypothetical protein